MNIKIKLSHPWESTEWTPKTNVSNTACSDHRECWNTTQGEVHCCTETRLEWHSYLMFSSVNPYNSVMRLHRVLEKAELTEWTPKTNVSNTACSDHRECWNTTQGEVHCCTETRLEWHSYLMFSSVNPYNSVTRLHPEPEMTMFIRYTRSLAAFLQA